MVAECRRTPQRVELDPVAVDVVDEDVGHGEPVHAVGADAGGEGARGVVAGGVDARDQQVLEGDPGAADQPELRAHVDGAGVRHGDRPVLPGAADDGDVVQADQPQPLVDQVAGPRRGADDGAGRQVVQPVLQGGGHVLGAGGRDARRGRDAGQRDRHRRRHGMRRVDRRLEGGGDGPELRRARAAPGPAAAVALPASSPSPTGRCWRGGPRRRPHHPGSGAGQGRRRGGCDCGPTAPAQAAATRARTARARRPRAPLRTRRPRAMGISVHSL